MDCNLRWDGKQCQGRLYVQNLVKKRITWHRVRMTTTATPQAERTGWTVDDGTFGARLALVRQKMDWNIKQAARECGLPAASWRAWERDGAEPRRLMEIAAAIADRTGCDYAWLTARPRLTTTTASRGRSEREINNCSRRPAEQPGPIGHPKRTTPDAATRRPGGARVSHAAKPPRRRIATARVRARG